MIYIYIYIYTYYRAGPSGCGVVSLEKDGAAEEAARRAEEERQRHQAFIISLSLSIYMYICI